MQIDLNSDLGEGFGPWPMGEDAKMLSLVSSANIACGGHAGDPETMFDVMSIAAEQGVIVGAHPGYNDREGFGRRVIPMSPVEVGHMVAAQIGTSIAVAAQIPMKVHYVKPHGALANLAARDADVALEIVKTIRNINPDLAILAISGTQLELIAKAENMRVFSEIFADRGYLSTGQLVPRGQKGAMIHDPKEATDRLLAFMNTGLMPVIDGDPIPLDAHSICVHGDSASAVEMTRQIREGLIAAGIQPTAFIKA